MMELRLEMRLEQKTRTYPINILGKEAAISARRRLKEVGLKSMVHTGKLVEGGRHYVIDIQISDAMNEAIQSVEESVPPQQREFDESALLDLIVEIAHHMRQQK